MYLCTVDCDPQRSLWSCRPPSSMMVQLSFVLAPPGAASIRMKQMSHYGSVQSSLLNVWEFLILSREEERSVRGPVWLFINLPFPLFFGRALLFFCVAHTERGADTKPEQSFHWLTLTSALTGNTDCTIKARGILWSSLLQSALKVLLVFKFWADETFETKKLQERPK